MMDTDLTNDGFWPNQKLYSRNPLEEEKEIFACGVGDSTEEKGGNDQSVDAVCKMCSLGTQK